MFPLPSHRLTDGIATARPFKQSITSGFQQSSTRHTYGKKNKQQQTTATTKQFEETEQAAEAGSDMAGLLEFIRSAI